MILELLSLNRGWGQNCEGSHLKREPGFQAKGGAVNRATCQAELWLRGGKGENLLWQWKPSQRCSAITEVINWIYNVTTYHTLSQWPWKYSGHQNIIVVLNWEWSVLKEICLKIFFEKEKSKKIPVQASEKQRAVCRGCCFSFPLLMNAEVICLSEEESRGEAWFPLHFICAPQPLPVSPPVLSHAGVPQEAALHEGQRSEEGRKPRVLWFSWKLTNTLWLLLLSFFWLSSKKYLIMNRCYFTVNTVTLQMLKAHNVILKKRSSVDFWL